MTVFQWIGSSDTDIECPAKGTDRIWATGRRWSQPACTWGGHESTAIGLLGLFSRRLLNLNGGNPIRLRRIHRDDSKLPVRVARLNGYCGLFSRRSRNHPALDQDGHAETGTAIALIDLFDSLFGCSLTSGTRVLGTGFALNEMQSTVRRRTRDIN